MEFNTQIYVCWSWNNLYQDPFKIISTLTTDNARIIGQSLNKSSLELKSWIESEMGSIINLGDIEGSAKVSIYALENLKNIICKVEKITNFKIILGIGFSLEQAYDSCNIAGKDSLCQVVFWTPQIAEIIDKINNCEKDELSQELFSKKEGGTYHAGTQYTVPHPKGSVSGWAHKGLRAEPKIGSGFISPKKGDQEKEKPNLNIENNLQYIKPEKAKKDIANILHSFAIKNSNLNDSKNNNNLEELKIKVGKLLLKIKDKIPDLQKLQEFYPELYDSYLILVKAFVDLSKELIKRQGIQKNEDLLYNEFEDLVKARFKLGRGLHGLPAGSIFDGRVKIEDKKTGRAKWRSILSGMVMGLSGNPASSLNPSVD